MTFGSVKEALAAAAAITLRLSYPSAAAVRVQRSPDPDRTDRAHAVRAAMRRAGVDPGGPVADLLFGWAQASDDATIDVDGLSDAELEDLRRQGDALADARRRVAVELRRAGLVPQRQLRMRPVGYRVVQLGRRRQLMMVVDPDERDPTVLRGPDARERAEAIVAGYAVGPVVQSVGLEPRQHPDLYAELAPRWRAGEFRTLAALDAVIAERLDCTARHARRVRVSWALDRGGGHRTR